MRLKEELPMKKHHLLLLLLLVAIAPWHLSASDNLITAKTAVQREMHTGFTRARTRLVLSAESAGRVAQVNADLGDVIGETPFACLDQTFIDLELQGNTQERDALLVDLGYYQKEVKRIRQLLQQNSSSQSQLDAARRNMDKTAVQVAALRTAEARLQEKKRRHCIQAPAGWQVIRRHVEPGQWVNVGEPVVEVGDYRSLLVPFSLTMTAYRSLLERAEGLSVNLPDQGVSVPAKLLRTSPAFDEVSRKRYLELEIGKGVTPRQGGIRVELEVDIPLRSGAVVVPKTALLQRYEQYWLRRSDGSEVRVVYLGSDNDAQGEWVSVVSPEVKPGDRFVLNPE
jgi:RND family efflux transporter MFP subunit